MVQDYTPPARRSAPAAVGRVRYSTFGRLYAQPPPPEPRPTLTVRAFPAPGRDAAVAAVAYAAVRPDRQLPGRAATFLESLNGDDLRVLYCDGADAADPAAGSHIGFTVLVEAPGVTPADLEELVNEQARDAFGEDAEAA